MDDSISETVVCKWCGRSFSRKAAERHVPFCEKWTKDHGRPQSPTFMYNTKSKADRAREVSIVKSVSIKLVHFCSCKLVNISCSHQRYSCPICLY